MEIRPVYNRDTEEESANLTALRFPCPLIKPDPTEGIYSPQLTESATLFPAADDSPSFEVDLKLDEVCTNESLFEANIMALDDEPLNLGLLADLLHHAGFKNVTLENDSNQALDRIRKVKPDLLLLDLNMPERSGYEFLEELSSGPCPILEFPILVITADTTPTARHRALALGASDFLTKPIDLIELKLRVRNLTSAHILRLRLKSAKESLELIVARRTRELMITNNRLREADRLKSEFVASASHELRTPLSVIREFSSLLNDGAIGSDPKEIADCHETIMRNCDRLGSLLDNLLDFHRIETGNYRLFREKVDIEPLIKGCTHDFAPKCRMSGIDLQMVTCEGLSPVLADRDSLVQVLINLIGNAIKFTARGGSITVGATQNENAVEVYVLDSGIGIAKENIDRAFELFGQINRNDNSPGLKGTGLGLPISRRLIKKHGGELNLESEVGIGSRFSFTIPNWNQTDEISALILDGLDSVTDGAPVSALVVYPVSGTQEQKMLAVADLLLLSKKLSRAIDAFTPISNPAALVCLISADSQACQEFLTRLTKHLHTLPQSALTLEFASKTLNRSANLDACVQAIQDLSFKESKGWKQGVLNYAVA